MDNLRLILLIIGCLFIIGLYLWEILYKSEPKKRENILDEIDKIPDMPVPNLTNHNDELDYSSAITDLGNLLTQSRNEVQEPLIEKKTEPELHFSADMSVKDYEEKMSVDDDFDVFAAVREDLGSQGQNIDYLEEKAENADELTDESQQVEEKSLGNVSNDLLALYVTSPANTMFNGLSISKAADAVGMIYGHMNIFHHFGPGKLHSGQPLFSMANMYEPGSFDLGRMADLRTKGVAIFMYSPASIEPEVVFELFLNTTQRIAKLLGGEVRSSDNELLNSAIIKSLRDKAELLSTHS